MLLSVRQSPHMGRKATQNMAAPTRIDITKNVTRLKWNTYLRAVTRGPEFRVATCRPQVNVECGTQGVRPVINAKGTFTIMSGSLSLPEVKQAMLEASKHFVHIDELMDAAGARIAEIIEEASGQPERLVAWPEGAALSASVDISVSDDSMTVRAIIHPARKGGGAMTRAGVFKARFADTQQCEAGKVVSPSSG